MFNLTPVSDEAARAFEERIAQTHFGSIETFVNLYNDGLIAKKSEGVTTLAADLVQAYREIELRGGEFAFLSEAEISSAELLVKAQAYSQAIELQRTVREKLSKGEIGRRYIFEDGKFYTIALDEDERETRGEEIRELSVKKSVDIDELSAALGFDLSEGDFELFEAFDPSPVITARAAF